MVGGSCYTTYENNYLSVSETSETQTRETQKEQNEIEIATVNPSDQSTESAENTDEEDPLKDTPLKMLSADIKMEVDDER